MRYGRNLPYGSGKAFRWLVALTVLGASLGVVIGVYHHAVSQSPKTGEVKLGTLAREVATSVVQSTPSRSSSVLGSELSPVHVGKDPRLPSVVAITEPIHSPHPTGWHVVASNPTPKPTPLLPDVEPFPVLCETSGRINILIIGVDGRSATYERSARADALVVLGVQFGVGQAQLLSIPRDLWVQIPGHGDNPSSEGRINTGYTLGRRFEYPGGGPAFQMHVITNALGLELDRYIVANFGAFEGMIDAIGGVDIYLESAIHDRRFPMGSENTMVLDFPAGKVHMDGATALMYARTRYADSDFGRMRRQQKVLMSVHEKLTSPAAILRLPALLMHGLGAVRTDLSWNEIVLLGCVVPTIGAESITRLVIDQGMSVPIITSGGGSVLAADMEAISAELAVFLNGD